MHDNLSIEEPVDEMDKLEQSFSEIIKARLNADQGKKLKTYNLLKIQWTEKTSRKLLKSSLD